MENWRDCPHLFANENFKVKEIDRSANGYSGLPMQIMDLDGLVLSWITSASYSLDNYTLIARPISDMTEEERNKWKYFLSDPCWKRMIPCYATQTEYLLSIGVYPFDQSHFDNGEVLNINEVEL